jgi:hypothetical protein
MPATGLFMPAAGPFMPPSRPWKRPSEPLLPGSEALDRASERLLPASGPWKGVSGIVKPVSKAVERGAPRSEPENTVPTYAGRLAPGGNEEDGLDPDAVQRVAHSAPAAVQDVGVDHGRRDVLVAEELLHRSNVVAGTGTRSRSAPGSAWTPRPCPARPGGSETLPHRAPPSPSDAASGGTG